KAAIRRALGEPGDGLFAVLEEGLKGLITFEGFDAREQLEKQDADRVQVRAPIDLGALALLRRHVARGSDHDPRRGDIGGGAVAKLGETEIENADQALRAGS